MARIGLISLCLLAACGTGTVAVPTATPPPAETDTSMLQRWTPNDITELVPESLALLARGWIGAGQPERAEIFLDEIERRGSAAYGLGFRWDAFYDGTVNPADTFYTVTMAAVGESLRQGGRDYSDLLAALETVPFVDGCWAYSNRDGDMGCVHNVNAVMLAFLSRIGGEYEAALAREQRDLQVGGWWYYWEEAPKPRPNDMEHQALSAYELLSSPDPRVRAQGREGAEWVRLHVDDEDAEIGLPEVALALFYAGYQDDACSVAAKLPKWADERATRDPYGSLWRRQVRAAFAYTLTDTECRLAN